MLLTVAVRPQIHGLLSSGTQFRANCGFGFSGLRGPFIP